MSDEEESAAKDFDSNLAIIREVYDSDSAHETFELELERALEACVLTIVIEPTTLGDETARWISVGNCLHKTAVLAGFSSITAGLMLLQYVHDFAEGRQLDLTSRCGEPFNDRLTLSELRSALALCVDTDPGLDNVPYAMLRHLGLLWRDSAIACVPLGTLSFFCTGVYTVSWQFDPCCKYQVEYDSRHLSTLPLQSLSSASPVVLVRKDDSKRKILHSFVSLAAASFCAWRLYNLYK